MALLRTVRNVWTLILYNLAIDRDIGMKREENYSSISRVGFQNKFLISSYDFYAKSPSD